MISVPFLFVLKLMPENYPSASEVVRNLNQLYVGYEVVETHGRFRIVRLEPPYFDGSELWIVNEKGFFWEPAANVEKAREYLASDEARHYNEAG